MLPLTGRILAATLLTAPLAGRVAAQHGPDLEWGPHARAEIRSPCIVVARLLPSCRAPLERALFAGGNYAVLDLEVQQVLKGSAGKRMELTLFAAPANHPHHYRPCAEELLDLVDRSVVVCFHPFGDYLFPAEMAHGTAIELATPSLVVETRERIAWHTELAERVPSVDPTVDVAVEAALRQITDDPAAQHTAIARLIELGPHIVPSLLARLDDRRPLPEPMIRLPEDSPHVTAAFRSLETPFVRDALLAVMTAVTGETFGRIEAEVEDVRAERAYQGWCIYAHYLQTERVEGIAKALHANVR